MNVSCPECRSTFRVDPTRVPADGVRARCSVCGGVITIRAEGVSAAHGRGAGLSFGQGARATQPVETMAPRRAQPEPAAQRTAGGSPIGQPTGVPSWPATAGGGTPGAATVPRPTAPAPQQAAAAGAGAPARGPLARPAVTPGHVVVQPPPQMPPRPITMPNLPPIPAPGGSRRDQREGEPPGPGKPLFGAPTASQGGAPTMPPRPGAFQRPPVPKGGGVVGGAAGGGGAAPAPVARFPAASPAAPSAGAGAGAGVGVPASPMRPPAPVTGAGGSGAAPAPPAAGARPAGPPATRPPINPFLANDPNQKAKRLARALVSDMITYHPQKREEGLRTGTLKQLFREEIKKSYEEYVEQVGKEFAETTSHFQDALNDVLAGGQRTF